MTFFIDQSFGIELKKRQNMFFTKYNASKCNTSLLCSFMFFRANISQIKLDKVSFLLWRHTNYQTIKFFWLYLQNSKRNEK